MLTTAQCSKQDLSQHLTFPILIALLVCLIPTTISALLSAVGIAGMDRLIQRNVIAKSGSAVEAAGDIDLLILDKTGTITIGNRMATEFLPVAGLLMKKNLLRLRSWHLFLMKHQKDAQSLFWQKHQFG